MNLQFFATTDVGQKRDHNEDTYFVDPDLQLFLVADGMGGHAAGEVASQIAATEISRVVRENANLIRRYAGSQEMGARQAVLSLLEEAMQTACATVFHEGQIDEAKRGMGTTTSVLLLAGDRGFIAHVGDSRIYLLRESQLHQLTEDHSLVNELVRRGKITAEEIDSSPYAKHKNAVTRAVGAYETVETDTIDFEVLPGDQFLLCSDGLHHYFETLDIPNLLTAEDAAAASQKLVDRANASGGHDNITAVVVKVEGSTDQAQSEAARALDLSNRIEVLRKMPLFKHLTYKEIIRLLNIVKVQSYEPGQAIIEENTDGEELFLVLQGRIRLQKGETVLTHLERGAHFGEMALVDRLKRSASAIAEEATRVLILERRDFYKIVRQEPMLATKLLWSFVQVLTERLRKTTEDLLVAQAEDISSEADVEDPVTPTN